MARVINADGAVAEAVDFLARGELVAIPTETVYGLAADAANGRAVARIFEAKNRPRFNPLIAHVADRMMARRIARFGPLADGLADRFWPGALTLVLPLVESAGVSTLVAAGLETIAVRMPVGVARDIAAELGQPLAAPSANPSGGLSATTADAVEAGLGGKVSLIVDGGPARIGVESTIVKIVDGAPTLLRPGGVPVEEVESVAGKPVERIDTAAAVEAPGMLISHYAPHARVRIDVKSVSAGESLLAFGRERAGNFDSAIDIINLSETGDLREAAANLFSFLRRLDRGGVRSIAVEPIPAHGLGAAINDRLARAAARRGESGE